MVVFFTEDSGIMTSWTKKHPDDWTSKMVIDWVYCIAGLHNIDGKVRGEAFQNRTGSCLQNMALNDFRLLSETHGHIFYNHYKSLCARANFHEPDPVQEGPMLTDAPRPFLLKSAPELPEDIEMETHPIGK